MGLSDQLKVDEQEYKARILKMEAYLNLIDSTLTKYESKEKEISSFLGESDNRFEETLNAMAAHVANVRTAREGVENAINMLNKTLDIAVNMAGASTVVKTLEVGIKVAVEAGKLAVLFA